MPSDRRPGKPHARDSARVPAKPSSTPSGKTARRPAGQHGTARPAGGAAGSSTGPRPGATPGSPRRAPAQRTEVSSGIPRMFSARALVLLVVVGIAFALLAPTVRSFIVQRASLEQLERDVAAARERDEDLQAELARWDDPSYVAAQARERLTYVMPGEVAFRVVDPEIARAVEDASIAAQKAAAEEAARRGSVVEGTSESPWYATLWGSVMAAGEYEVGTPPGPEPEIEPQTETEAELVPVPNDTKPADAPADTDDEGSTQ